MFLEGLGREARQGGIGREDTQSFAQAGLEAHVVHPQAHAQGGACGCGPREEADRRQLGVCSQGASCHLLPQGLTHLTVGRRTQLLTT